MDTFGLLAPSIAVVVGGLFGSFGLNMWLSGRTGSRLVSRWARWGLAGYYVVVLGLLGGGLTWVVRAVRAGTSDGPLESPWFYLAFGLIIGLPFTLPRVTGIWRAAHAPPPAKKKRKPAPRSARVKYAKDLERQLMEYVGDDRTIRTDVRGDDARVLVLRGELDRQEGERLVAVLRADIEAVDFQRVEGEGGKGNWWVRLESGEG